MNMTKKPFNILLTDDERAALDVHRARLGFRSDADVIRHWIGQDQPLSAADDAIAELGYHGPRRRPKPPKIAGVIKGSEMVDAPAPYGRISAGLSIRLPIGSIRREMGKDPKSNAPVLKRKWTLVRYDDDGKEVWE